MQFTNKYRIFRRNHAEMCKLFCKIIKIYTGIYERKNTQNQAKLGKLCINHANYAEIMHDANKAEIMQIVLK